MNPAHVMNAQPVARWWRLKRKKPLIEFTNWRRNKTDCRTTTATKWRFSSFRKDLSRTNTSAIWGPVPISNIETNKEGAFAPSLNAGMSRVPRIATEGKNIFWLLSIEHHGENTRTKIWINFKSLQKLILKPKKPPDKEASYPPPPKEWNVPNGKIRLNPIT